MTGRQKVKDSVSDQHHYLCRCKCHKVVILWPHKASQSSSNCFLRPSMTSVSYRIKLSLAQMVLLMLFFLLLQHKLNMLCNILKPAVTPASVVIQCQHLS